MTEFKSFYDATSTIQIDEPVERVVVTGYPDYDSLVALGLADKIVAAPKSHQPKYLGQISADIADIGNLHDPDLEVIKAAKPDLIILSERARKHSQELSQIAPVFHYETTNEHYWQHFRDINLELAKIFDKEDQAQALIAALDQAANQVQAYNADHSDQKTLTLMLSEGDYRDFSGHSRFAFIYQYLNFQTADNTEITAAHGRQVTGAEIDDMNPDRIFVIDRTAAISAADDEDLLASPALKETKASQAGAVYELSPDLWYLSGGGLESTKQQIAEIQKALH
ncbi:hypothetical protein AWM75_07600 [Aerococcus urinaehominis]|uniref:Uncharacterized protein n=1 Tax=Aerococcus urinaehominis TaxID=128944 RepID=A0A120IB20_9LACT|nr:ABC transporter substrate-binding protein [Aerococcus urinaehominis]AMB99836.1 hypothetical protein AWM75_07600 [Aerococcus urinaehominis]SDM55946.1 iron complex transport system substrate-binding protein [Aerococcus urinaehominis]